MESTYSNLLSEIFEKVKEPELEALTEFPNDAYKDLMILVTKYKLNNKADNAIIQFFNKHSALSKSPLLKKYWKRTNIYE